MQNSLDQISSTIFFYAVFYTKTVLAVAIFAVKTVGKDHTDHTASPTLAKKRRKTSKNYCWVLLIETTMVLNYLKGKL